jgi:hypothetical protein
MSPRTERPELSPGLSKLSSKLVFENTVEVDMLLGELNSWTDRAVETAQSIDRFSAHRHEMPVSLERR